MRTTVMDGQPWFVAKDVCEILELGNVTRAVERLRKSQKGLTTIQTPGGKQRVNVISEAGVYKLVFTSRKPEAERFTDWVASEVIPAIRQHGMYATPQAIEAMLQDPDTMIRTLQVLKEERQARIVAETQIALDKPKVIFADAVTASKSSILVGELAKLLRQNGVNTGQNRLFLWLRENGYLVKRRGTDYNMPTQYSMELGLFEVKETIITHSDGHISISKTPKITGKGQLYFINKFRKEVSA